MEREKLRPLQGLCKKSSSGAHAHAVEKKLRGLHDSTPKFSHPQPSKDTYFLKGQDFLQFNPNYFPPRKPFILQIPVAMSPIAAAVPGSAAKDYKAESTLARLLGSGMSLILFGDSSKIWADNLQALPVLLSSLSSTLYCRTKSLMIRLILIHWRSTPLRSVWWVITERYDRHTWWIGRWRQTSDGFQITSASQLNRVIFKEKAAAPVGTKFFSLFPGLGYAAGYKVSDTYRMGLYIRC